MDILATTGDFTLLENSRIPPIGYIRKKKRWLLDGTSIEVIMVCFHFGTKLHDYFFFENGDYSYSAISISREVYLQNKYKEILTKHPYPSAHKFIEDITRTFVIKELGFED